MWNLDKSHMHSATSKRRMFVNKNRNCKHFNNSDSMFKGAFTLVVQLRLAILSPKDNEPKGTGTRSQPDWSNLMTYCLF